MVLNFFYKFVTPWGKANKRELLKNRIIGYIANKIYKFYDILPMHLKEVKYQDVIISLTTYPARINKAYLCLVSLLRQNCRANKVILWLAKEQFPNLEKDIPKRILKLKKKGLEIKFCDDLKSYKKFYYTAKEYQDYIIVTADDDTLYPENWLERLMDIYYKYEEKCVVCYRAHEITFDKNNHILPYKEWNGLAVDKLGPSNTLIAIGVGGILYPKKFFKDFNLDTETIFKCSPTTDDIYLKIIAVIKKYKIVKVEINSKEWFTIRNSQRTSLRKVNVEKNNENDKALHNLMEHYKISEYSFMEE